METEDFKDIMNSFPEDLLAIIIAKLPIKIFMSFKLVCKQWKSIVDSPYFRHLFQSMHKNSHSSSWSIISWRDGNEVVAHYGFNTWGLELSLGFYISSFLTNKFTIEINKYRIWNYTDVGLILISEADSYKSNRSLYVANPFTQECVEIPYHAHIKEYSPMGIVTRTENNVLLDYKVVVAYFKSQRNLSLLIYSSETGLWSLNTVHFSFSVYFLSYCTSLHGTIHFLAGNSDREEVVVSIDLYATGEGSVQCHVTPFPDLEKHPRFNRFCITTCQGFLMYMNIIHITKVDGSLEEKLCVWRLKNEEWQLVSEITPDFIDISFEYIPLGINPSDAKTFYFWSKKDKSLLSINLCNGKFVVHGELAHSRDGHTLNSFDCFSKEVKIGSKFTSCILPEWPHRIPMKKVLS